MTLVPNETEQALNRQHDVYAAAREEYRKRIAELAAENERLRAGLREVSAVLGEDDQSQWMIAHRIGKIIDAALEEKR